MNTGILFTAIGKHWQQEAIIASENVKKFMPSFPITVFSDSYFNSLTIDIVIVVEKNDNPFFSKTFLVSNSPK